jgi:hypothetical protein
MVVEGLGSKGGVAVPLLRLRAEVVRERVAVAEGFEDFWVTG